MQANSEDPLLRVSKLEHPANCIEVMQFTGLKDKNGKEIFESDILGLCINYQQDGFGNTSSCLGGHNPRFPWIVEFKEYHDKESYYDDIHLGFIATSKEDAVGNIHTKTLPDIVQCAEVIGNIYENPELLKQTKGD